MTTLSANVHSTLDKLSLTRLATAAAASKNVDRHAQADAIIKHVAARRCPSVPSMSTRSTGSSGQAPCRDRRRRRELPSVSHLEFAADVALAAG